MFSMVQLQSEEGQQLTDFLQLAATDDNIIRGLRFERGTLKKYKCESNNVEQCVSLFKKKDVEPYYKSDPVPQDNKGTIKIVVGKTFEKLVMSSKKYILLCAYSPTSEQSKLFMPIFEELGTILAGNKEFMLFKMDATNNEHPEFHLHGYPTLNFYLKNDKPNPIRYKGKRTVADILRFIDAQTGLKLSDTLKKEEEKPEPTSSEL